MAEKVELIIEVKGGESVGKASEKVTSLKTQLKELKAQLQSGALSPEEFDKVAEKAGEISDRIADVSQKVKVLGSDTKRLDGFIGIATGITSGFAAAEGAMALFGSENEDLQKTLVKVQGATALLSGLQGIQLALQKESAAMTAIQSARLQILTFIQTRYTAAVGGTTGAMRLLRIAGAALGIGLIIGAIALLVANFDKLKNVISKFLPSLDTIAKGFKIAYNAVTDFLGITNDQTRAYDKLKISTDQRSKDLKREIELLEAQGASERVLFQKRLELIDNELRVLQAKKDAKQALSEEEIQAEKDLNNQRLIERAKYNKSLDEEIENDKKAKREASKKAADKQKALDDRVAKAITEQEERDRAQALELEEEKNDKYAKVRAIDTANLVKNSQEKLFDRQEYKNQVLAIEQSIVDSQIGIATQASQFLNQIAGDSKGLALTSLAIEKAAAIANVIINTQREISSYYAAAAARSLLTGGTTTAVDQALAAKQSIFAKVRAGISIASIGAAGLSGAKSIASSGGTAPSGGNQPTNQSPNIKGFQTGSTGRQSGQGGSMKVYVTETDIRKATNKTNNIYYQATVD